MNASVAYEEDVSIPAELESARAKLVYLYVAVRGSATADDVCEALHIDKGSVLRIAATLRERGLLHQEDGRYGVA
ncbi:helix-turn-helix domain-containing protein [Natronobiforma cellulositropha]|uniref:helix-turn-helix domain-containing protein n=1 Tax=Natronobiforma cellulositropha TaxID=1679076 RepID=UPI0021D613CF|nr:helix-turn-helix domain-containing protein [Natronobiforma cellulositropha]